MSDRDFKQVVAAIRANYLHEGLIEKHTATNQIAALPLNILAETYVLAGADLGYYEAAERNWSSETTPRERARDWYYVVQGAVRARGKPFNWQGDPA